MKSVWTIPPPESWEKRAGKHPAQKPVALVERILLASSNEGDLILDPFSGSGTSAVAAFRLSRQIISIEMESNSINHAIRRIVSQLIVVHIGTVVLHRERNVENDLDPQTHSVDRSVSTKTQSMSAAITAKPIHTERSFYFVGSDRREIIFMTTASSLDDAWLRFHASPRASAAIMFVIKTETEIYLAQ
jgi:DNA methylase